MRGTVGLQVFLYTSLLACGFVRFTEGSAECGPKDFNCTNGNCTRIYNVCEGVNDCGDNSDEKVCDPFQCHPSAFQCLNGKCISRGLVCFLGDSCGDNSDEEMCVPFQCHPSAFQCSNGKCISRFQFCNGRDHCGDNSDEGYCNIGKSNVCPPGWSECPNNRSCFPSHWMCDGYPDCPDGSDERNCGNQGLPGFPGLKGETRNPGFPDPAGLKGDKGNPGLPGVPGAKGDQGVPGLPGFNGMKGERGYHGEKGDSGLPGLTGKEGVQGPPGPPGPSGLNEDKCIIPPQIEKGDIGLPGFPGKSGFEGPKGFPGEIPLMNDASDVKMELKSYLLSRRKSGSSSNRWGSQVHRIAVALHLADNSTFAPGNSIGEEIRNELTMQLLYRFPKNKMSSEELAMYIHALLVSCLDPRDLYGGDMVRELRRMVEATGNYTNPFLILVLCNAGDTMTPRDVDRVKKAFSSQHRPVWTGSQALSSMALSCITSANSELVDERILTGWLQDLKKRQFRNGTVDNFRTTALVSQALFIHDSYKKFFDLDSAIKVLVDGLNGRKSLLNTYYALPVLHGKSLLNVSSSHCSKQPVEEEDALKKVLDVYGEKIIVQYSIWMGDDINLGRTWRLRMLFNSTIYEVIETVAKIENNQNVQYDVVDGKPYVTALNDEEDDPELGTFWFIYLKAVNSDESPNIVKESPVDIKLTPNQEIIMWYKRAPWNGQTSYQKQVTSN